MELPSGECPIDEKSIFGLGYGFGYINVKLPML